MKLFIITGTSSGIGLALAQELLKDPENHVLGISRRQAIEHERYTHKRLELSKLTEVMDFEMPITGTENELYLINNAGWIGEIGPLGKIDHEALEESININLAAPAILSNQFLGRTEKMKMRRVIVNISSGAAQNPIKSWGSYCASKAGIDMLTRVINEESPDVECYSIYPGIVNTHMQQNIRDAKPDLFPDLGKFKGFYESGELKSPEEVAKQIVHLINHPEEITKKVFSLRDLNPSSL